MRHKWIICLIFMLVCFPVSAAQAETRSLIFLLEGDLWAWNPDSNEQTQLTDGLFAMSPRISPDGTKVAFNALAPLVIAEYGHPLSIGTDFADIWILDTGTNELTQIAEQPDDATLVNGLPRSAPAWSPDGLQLAWAEPGAIIVYDFPSGETRILYQGTVDSSQDAGLVVPALNWGSHLAYMNNYMPREVTFVFDQDGTLYQYENQHWEYYLDMQIDRQDWVLHNGEWWLGLRLNGGAYHLMGPETGERLLLESDPTLQLIDEPDGALRLAWNRAKRGWEIISPDGDAFLLDAYSQFQPSPVISPDGNQVAYLRENELFVWANGTITKIVDTVIESRYWQNTQGIVWGAMAWRTDGRAIPTETPDMPFPGG